MRYLTITAIICLALTTQSAWGLEGLPSLNGPLTLVVQYETQPPAESLAEMRRELNTLLQKSSIQVEWRLREEMKPGTQVSDLVLVKFRGSCRMQVEPALLDERGPLAFTHTTDGEVLPFSEVLCDKVRVAARSAMHGGQLAQGNRLMGRAMARVLAHEIYHIAGNTKGHTKEGVSRRALTGAQLIAEHMDFDQLGEHALHRKEAR
ncbi:hypothetical protein [uncultured Paludibaculum sp.]|uniref:hypothetical protein n=1 Tax=uncultured Paludibaculum sp. TaxID=1765020 RepID=UPI002AAADF5D|nr:hypothetical protein [uncultured Paludibaculum sp.]